MAGYEQQYDKLDPHSDIGLLAEAKASLNRLYLNHLSSEGEPFEPVGWSETDGRKKYKRKDAFERSSTGLSEHVEVEDVSVGFTWLYDGVNADMIHVQLSASKASIISGDGTANV